MDALTGFVTIVSLLGVWKAESNSRETRSFQEYLDWLRRHEHNALVELITGNLELTSSLRHLIDQNHDAVMIQLEQLGATLASVAANLDEFAPLVRAISPTLPLSEQSIDFLRQLNAAGAKTLREINDLDGAEYAIEGAGSLQIYEPRFLDDDLGQLVDLGLLMVKQIPHGRVFTITRAGALAGRSRDGS